MSNDYIISLRQSEETVSDALTQLLRNGAKEQNNLAAQAELNELLSLFSMHTGCHRC